MNNIKRQAIERIRTHLKSKDLEDVAKLPLRNGANEFYSLRTIQAVAYGNRDNDIIFQALLDKVEEKLANMKKKIDSIHQLSNGT